MEAIGCKSRRRLSRCGSALFCLSLCLLGPASGAAARVITGTMPRDPQRQSPWAWEPGMAMDSRGTIWVAGNHCPLIDQHGACELDPTAPGAQLDYVPLWRSTDGGRSYQFLSDPIRAPTAAGGLLDRPGGLDTDVAVAPRSRHGHPPLLYVVSSYVLGSTLAISADGGRTWRVAQSAGVPTQDRPWLATGGRCNLYLGYHPLTGSFDVAAAPRVERYNGCALYRSAAVGQVVAVPETSTLVEPATYDATKGDQDFAKPVAVHHTVYVAFLDCDTVPPVNISCNGPTDHQSLHVAISRDRGASFEDVRLPAPGLRTDLNDGVWPISLGADRHGAVAVAVTDTRHVYLWRSRDGGRHWQRRRRPLDAPLGWNLATVPSVALRNRSLAVAWYGSAPADSSSPQRWVTVLARSRDGGRTFRVQALPPVLAKTGSGKPLADALCDDFGAAITRRGPVALAYTQSCAGHPPTDRTCPGPRSGEQATADVVRYALVGRG